MVAIDVRSELRKERERRAAQRQGREDPVTHNGPSLEDKAGEAALQAFMDSALLNNEHFGDLSTYQIAANAIQGLYYIPDFINNAEENAIVRFIDAMPGQQWADAGERRMLNWGGRPGDREVKEALPGCIQRLVERMVKAKVYDVPHAPNHCLVNEYCFGAGISPHQDGELYFPCVATITLEGPAMMEFQWLRHNCGVSRTSVECDGKPAAQVLLQPRGLLLMRGDAYTQLLHSIKSQRSDTVTNLCANIHLIQDVHEGCIIERAAKRKSLVFVHKRQEY